jgi:hypothetical protein
VADHWDELVLRAPSFTAELHDQRAGNRLQLRYRVNVLDQLD